MFARQSAPKTAETHAPMLAHKTRAPVGQKSRVSQPSNPMALPVWAQHGARPLALQTSLEIGEPGDIYEQEADRVADQVMRMVDFGPRLQRCACGGAAGPDGECEACRARRLRLQRVAGHTPAPREAPPVVHDVLRSPGQPLDRETRGFMEAGFGQDFGHVRVHIDALAAASAHAVNARAYTVGHHIAFAGGQFAPQSANGRRLLAHELAHTLQQGSNANVAPLTLDSPASTHERTVDHAAEYVVAGRAARQLSTTVAGRIQREPAPPPITPTEASVCRIHFEHARTEFTDAKEFDRCMKASRGYLKGDPSAKVALYGYASVEGDPKFNEDLAQSRADTVKKLLGQGGLPRDRILAFGRGVDNTFPTRPENRRVEVVPFQKVELPEEKVTVPKPEQPTHFCGPDVTKQVSDSVSKLKSDFRGLSAEQKDTSCDWLRDEVYGLIAWDIRPLHQQKWIKNDYGDSCAQNLGDGGVCCHRSVQIGNSCHYAGSVNYVIFGAMCRECFNHYATEPVNLSGVYNFRATSMLSLIQLYKGGEIPGVARASNVENSKKWASAGYEGWPSGGTPPKGDCAKCAPCPQLYVGRDFDVRWCPYIDPKKACPENRAQVIREERR